MSVVEEVLLNPTEEKVKVLNSLIKNCEIEFSYIEERILSSNDARLLYLAGLYIEWINLGRVSHSLSRTKDSFYILRFAWFIKEMPDSKEKTSIIKDLANGIIRSKEPRDIYYFARDIKGAPIEKLAISIAKSNNSTYIFYTARDLYSKISIDTRIELAHRVIALKNARDILFVSNIVSEISLIEYANAMLNAKKDEFYGVHLCMFMKDHELPAGEIKTDFINKILKSNDYKRISDLIKETDNVPYAEMIDYLLKVETNYYNTDFWLNYILPLATSNKSCASYAVQKIIESNNIEVISITIYYINDEFLRQKLQNALNKVADLNKELSKTTLGDKVITRVRDLSKKNAEN